jgi:putative transposase
MLPRMAIPSRANNHGTYFVTSRTYNSRRLFQSEQNGQLFLDTLQHYRNEGRYKLHAFVVMPDHIHLLLTPAEDITLERTMQLIKGGFSKRLNSKLSVWQRGFTDHRIRDREDWDKHLAYIHDNPVRAKLCQRPEDYPFSSVFRRADLRG